MRKRKIRLYMRAEATGNGGGGNVREAGENSRETLNCG